LSTNLQSSIEHELANLAAQDLDLGQVISTEGLLDSLNLAIA
jgi:hypothetical protein